MAEQKVEQKQEVPDKDLCNHQHPGGATAWQILNVSASEILTEGGPVKVNVAAWICPYCNSIKYNPVV